MSRQRIQKNAKGQECRLCGVPGPSLWEGEKIVGTIIAVTAAAGMGGTGLGGLAAYLFRRGTDRTVSVLLSFAAGMMLAVVCADLLTDAIQAGPGLSALPAASASVLAGCGGILAPGGAGKRAAGRCEAGRALSGRCGDGSRYCPAQPARGDGNRRLLRCGFWPKRDRMGE